MADSAETLSILARLAEQALPPEAGPLRAEESLTEKGLDSVGMVDLLTSVEESFGVTIPPSEVTPENFATLADLARLLARLHG